MPAGGLARSNSVHKVISAKFPRDICGDNNFSTAIYLLRIATLTLGLNISITGIDIQFLGLRLRRNAGRMVC